jgi:hypothetical protein
MRNKKVLFITQAAMIAALYVVLTKLISAFNLASGAIQIRISEMLCILPVFTPAAIPGLFAGCLIANTLTGSIIWDIIFGSIATLLGAIGTYLLRKKALHLHSAARHYQYDHGSARTPLCLSRKQRDLVYGGHSRYRRGGISLRTWIHPEESALETQSRNI